MAIINSNAVSFFPKSLREQSKAKDDELYPDGYTQIITIENKFVGYIHKVISEKIGESFWYVGCAIPAELSERFSENIAKSPKKRKDLKFLNSIRGGCLINGTYVQHYKFLKNSVEAGTWWIQWNYCDPSHTTTYKNRAGALEDFWNIWNSVQQLK